MAYIWWDWDSGIGRRLQFRELTVDFTIHGDVRNFSDRHGLYLMLGYATISDVAFYYGLQTGDNGLIFSRWGTDDLANAREAPDGWSNAGEEGGAFIGVRRGYEWGEGDYRVRLASDGIDTDGEWWGLWITDLDEDTTTWFGSMKFPFKDGYDSTWVEASTYTTIEIYGTLIRPINIPEWRVTVYRPVGDGIPSSYGHTGYSMFSDSFSNSDIHYDSVTDSVELTVGGTTERQTPPQTVIFK